MLFFFFEFLIPCIPLVSWSDLGEKAHHCQQHTHLVLLSSMLVLVGEKEEEEFPIITLPTQRVRCWKTRTTSELPFFPSLPIPS
jgi:hypothetical protein